MSDYNGNDIWNKYVLSSRLNESTDRALLMLTGSVFHAVGPATVKEQSSVITHSHIWFLFSRPSFPQLLQNRLVHNDELSEIVVA